MLFQIFINSKFINATSQLQFPTIPTYPPNKSSDILSVDITYGIERVYISPNITQNTMCLFHIGAVRVIVLPKGRSNKNDQINLIISKPIDLLVPDKIKALGLDYNEELCKQIELDLFGINKFVGKEHKLPLAFIEKCKTGSHFLFEGANVNPVLKNNKEIYDTLYNILKSKPRTAHFLGLSITKDCLDNDPTAEAFMKGIYYITCFPFNYYADFSFKLLHSSLKNQKDNLIKINTRDLLFFEFSVIPWYRKFIFTNSYDIKYEFVSSQLFTYQENMDFKYATKEDVEIFKKELCKMRKMPVLKITWIHRLFGGFIYSLPIIFCIIIFIKYKCQKED